MTTRYLAILTRSVRARSWWHGLLGVVLVLAGCAKATPEREGNTRPVSSAAFPVRVVDDSGRSVLVPQEPLRIITLLPSFTETVFALGVGARLVGVDDFSDYPNEVARLPKLGGAYDTQLERVMALRPDLVLLSDDSKAASALAGNGVNVFGASPRKLADVFVADGYLYFNRSSHSLFETPEILADMLHLGAFEARNEGTCLAPLPWRLI